MLRRWINSDKNDSLPYGNIDRAVQGAEGDEVQWLRCIAAGELPAFERLYRAYHPRLTRFLDRVMRRPGLVEEVLNDTLLVVWHGAARYNGTSKVSTWIFAIAYRKALKALQRLDEPLEDDAADERADSGPGPEQQLSRGQLHAVLARALDELSAEHRAVVDLTYFHGIGYREIAQIVACPVDTVKTRMFHARRRLRALLGGRLEDWL
jgi:RNA polymerase sigma factor (sigma-70 family)